MSKLNTFRLRRDIGSEEFDYVLLSGVLSSYSGPRQKIHQLLKTGIIRRVKKGLYVFGPEYNQVPVCAEVLANQIYGPSCLSMESALSHYGLIPERVTVYTSVTPKKGRVFDTCLGRFAYQHLALKSYPHGIEQVWLDESHPVLMASPEKAICDYLSLRFQGHLDNAESVRQFLVSDLRISQHLWDRFSPDKLKSLNEHYQSDNIRHLQETL